VALGAMDAALGLTQRTFVASTGSDAETCTRTQPCRSFAAAIAKTSDKGEVIVLDSAGYGPVAIAQSTSIVAPPGAYAGITVFAGTGVTIAGSNIAVVLRGLTINGQGGDIGIDFQQGASLAIESCEVTSLNFAGIDLRAPGSMVQVRNVQVRRTGFGVFVNSASGTIRVAIDSSEITNGGTGVVVSASGAAILQATVARSVISGNSVGVEVYASPGTIATLLSDGNTIVHTEFTVFLFSGFGGTEAIYSPGNNTVGYYGNFIYGGTLTPCCGV
jgi:hypothetical protein